MGLGGGTKRSDADGRWGRQKKKPQLLSPTPWGATEGKRPFNLIESDREKKALTKKGPGTTRNVNLTVVSVHRKRR